MPVTVLIADDSSVKATNCAETIKALKDLCPEVLLFDLRMPESHDQPMIFRDYLDQTKIVAMTFGTDEIAKALAEHIGATILIDKADLTTELIPLIVGLMQKVVLVQEGQ